MQISPLFFDRQLDANEINKIAVLRKPGNRDQLWVSGNFSRWTFSAQNITSALQLKTDAAFDQACSYSIKQLQNLSYNINLWNKNIKKRNDAWAIVILNIFIRIFSFGYCSYKLKPVNFYLQRISDEGILGYISRCSKANVNPRDLIFFKLLNDEEIEKIVAEICLLSRDDLLEFLISLNINLINSKIFEKIITTLDYYHHYKKRGFVVNFDKGKLKFKNYPLTDLENIVIHLIRNKKSYFDFYLIIQRLVCFTQGLKRIHNSQSALLEACKTKDLSLANFLIDKSFTFNDFDHDYLSKHKQTFSADFSNIPYISTYIAEKILTKNEKNKLLQDLMESIYETPSLNKAQLAVKLFKSGSYFNPDFMSDSIKIWKLLTTLGQGNLILFFELLLILKILLPTKLLTEFIISNEQAEEINQTRQTYATILGEPLACMSPSLHNLIASYLF